MAVDYSLEDYRQLLEAASEFANYPGVQINAAAREFLDRFPLPVIISALQTGADVAGLEHTLVLEELDELKKKTDAQFEEILPIEQLIGEAYSVIDKTIRVGTLHRNTGARRKSRLARTKKAVEIHHRWYAPAPAPAPVLELLAALFVPYRQEELADGFDLPGRKMEALSARIFLSQKS